jgi:hypothetical protein
LAPLAASLIQLAISASASSPPAGAEISGAVALAPRCASRRRRARCR